MQNLEVAIKLKASVDQFVSAIKQASSEFGGSFRGIEQTATQTGDKVEAAMDKLGLRRHDEIEADIRQVERAYRELASTGELSERELAQAGLKTKERIRELRAETNGWSESLGKMKGELAAAGAAMYGIGRVLGSAAGAASEFGSAMAEVSTLLDDTSGMDQLSESVRAMAREFGGSAKDQAKALYQIISSGASDAAEATDLLTASNKLAVGGVTDITSAADGLTTILNAYGEAAGGTANVSDAMFTAMKAGKTTIGELSTSIGQVAPIAAQAGVGIDELLASVATLTSGGLKTSESMTQIRGALASVIKPAAETQKLADELGLSFDAASLKSKGWAGFLDEVKRATGGNIETMGKLFGSVEGLNAVLTLTGKGAEKFADTLGAMADKAGATDTAFAKMADSPEMAAKRFKAAMGDIQISLGQAVTAFAPLLESVTDVVNAFNELPAPIKTTAAALGFVAAALPPLIISVGALSRALGILRAAFITSAVGGFVSNMGAATGAVTALRAALLRLPWVAVAAGAYAAGAAIRDALKDTIPLLATESERIVAESQMAFDASMAHIAQLAGARANELKAYADQQIAAIDELKAKSEDEVTSYRDRLTSASRYYGYVLEQQKALGNAQGVAEAKARIDEYEAALGQAAERMGELRKEQEAAARAERPFQKQAEDMVSSALAARGMADEIRRVSAQSSDAKQQIAELIGQLDLTDPAQVEQLARAMDMLRSESEQSAQVVEQQLTPALIDLISKMSSADLLAFSASLGEVFKSGQIAAEDFARINDEVVSESLKRLGVDASELETGFTATGKAAIAAFQAIATNAQASGKQIGAAFDAALSKLSTPEELKTLQASLQQAFDAGRVSAQAARPALAAVAEKLQDTKAGADAAKDSIEQLLDLLNQPPAGTALSDATGEVNDHTAAEERSIRAANEAIAAWITFWTNLRTSFYDMSDAVGQAYDDILEKTASMNYSMSGFYDQLGKQTQQLTAEFEAQSGAYDTMMARVQSGTLSVYALNTAALTASSSFNLLGDNQLTELRAAIDDAQAKIDRLEASGQRTLDTLQDKLDRLQGNDAAIQQRAYERQRADIEAQLAEAKKYGSQEAVTDLQHALQLLTEINAEETRRRRDKNRPGEDSSRRVRIDLVSDTSKASVYADNEKDLVTLLQNAKLRSA